MTSLTPKQTTLFAVARNGKPINDDATADLRSAQQLLTNAADGMIGAGLEPDLELVTIEQTISFGEPQRYVEPTPVDEAEAQPYDGVKVAELKAQIAKRNEDRDEGDQLSTEGNRADLVATLVEDDATQAARGA